MVTTNYGPLTRYTDQLLAEIAARIQLSPSRHRQAIQRYQTVAKWLERDGSPLQDNVSQMYPQGSMAIGATILSRDSDDRYDIDVAAELDLPQDSSPKLILDTLYQVVKGERGSQYYAMTRRRSRCVTIEYAEMHLDITPMIRRLFTPDRESWIFENRKETPTIERRLIANPHGFAEWFNELTQVADDPFARAFGAIAKSYDILAADLEPVPDHEELENKSQPTIVLQLIKQWRNVQYQGREDKGPPSVVLSRIVAESSDPSRSLSKDLEITANKVATYIEMHNRSGQPITNPVCEQDILTDRWRVGSPEAVTFVQNLRRLAAEIGRVNSGCELGDARRLLAGLFGEYPTREAMNRYAERVGQAIRNNETSHEAVTGSVVVPSVANSRSRNTRPTRPHQFHKPAEL